jgi:3',5'-cyclic AMP phosphodiesterase CpdA
LRLLLFTAALALLIACGRDNSSSTDDDQTGPFQFIVLSDTHVRLPGEPDDEVYANQCNLDNLQAAIERINSNYESVDFVAVTGDLVGNLYSEDVNDYLTGEENPAETFAQMMDTLIPPFYVALGNHDYQKGFDSECREGISTSDIEAIEAVWRKVLGIEPYYAFTHRGIKMIFLNSNRGPLRDEVCEGSRIEAFCTGSFDDEQLIWLEDRLNEGSPAILFVHHPPYSDNPNVGWTFYHSYRIDPEDYFYDLIYKYRDKILAIFVGHGHRWKEDTLHGIIPVFETGAIGDQFGRADDIRLVEVDPDTRALTTSRLDPP